MNTLRGTICLWLCLMYAGVECWPKVRLSSRQEKDEGTPTITIDFYIDESLNVTENKIKTYLQTVTWQARDDLRSYFLVDGINIQYRIKDLDKEPNLKAALNLDKTYPYKYMDGAIDALLSYFEEKNNPDINILLTGIELYNGDDIRKGLGYSKYQTLCQSVVAMLLAYAPYTPYSAGRMLAELVRDSVNPDNVPYVHTRRYNFTARMEDYLSTCNNGTMPPGGEEPVTPPQEKPTDSPDHTEGPLPPVTAAPPEETPTPGPPAPETPTPQPPAPTPPTPQPTAPEPPSVSPSEPGEKPTPPPEPSTTTGVPDYC
ncbi:protein piccolo-like [Ixodes scapularis]|uniref:protein piccolo-like n=1 Tax=Ixodes scapularis TaxID=6945 RepID=UPI001A9D0841|nr:protein piccolo-like [Ixodes scapularis]